MTKKQLAEKLATIKNRSAWDKGVQLYAEEILNELPDNVDYSSRMSLNADLLDGATNWQQYSEGGCGMIYDAEIAERLCSPSELKKTRNGERNPNSRENWIDVQARALNQAANRILKLYK